MEEYKDKASFEEFFKQNYVPLDYKSIRNEMREAAGDGWSLFTDEYKFRGKLDKKDFIVHMTGDAYCTFEEIVENAIDELNSGILDIVMEIGNEMEFDNDTAEIYFDTIEKQLTSTLYAAVRILAEHFLLYRKAISCKVKNPRAKYLICTQNPGHIFTN